MAIWPRCPPLRTTPSRAVSGPMPPPRSPTPSTERRTETAPAPRLIGIAALMIYAGCPDRHDMASHRDQPSTMLRFGPAANAPMSRMTPMERADHDKRREPGRLNFSTDWPLRHRTSGGIIRVENAMNRHPARETGGSARDGSRRAETASGLGSRRPGARGSSPRGRPASTY